MLLKLRNPTAGTVDGIVAGGAEYIAFTSVKVNASNVITHIKRDNGGTYAALASGLVAEMGEIPSRKGDSFNVTVSS